jgi:hypothetical protein
MQVRTNRESQEQGFSYIGDDPEGPIYPGWVPYIPMSTALAYFFCDEGFVIAADGRNTLVSAKGREIVSEQAQKIFPVHGIEREAAFSFTGRTTLFDPADDHKVFDFPLEFSRATRDVQSEIMNVKPFVSAVCSLVQERLDLTIQGAGIGKLPSRRDRGNPSEHNIITIHLDGYFSGYPVRVGAHFYHVQQKISWDTNAEHTLEGINRYWTRLFGSDKIASLLLHTEDTRLSGYRTEACRRVAACCADSSINMTLQNAIEAGRNFIAACSDDSLREIDPENCRGIGGHIHIATITPKAGFQWASGFEPMDAATQP